jgi:hypothetical protein
MLDCLLVLTVKLLQLYFNSKKDIALLLEGNQCLTVAENETYISLDLKIKGTKEQQIFK